MKIGRGEFVFLVGPTGCGKSTCIRLLMKELEATEGDILISGHSLPDMPRRKVPRLRRNIGVVFQDYKLLPNRTVYANVAYALEVIGENRQSIRRKVPDILRLVGLSTKLHSYPDELSGGEQQRVSIARAFVNHPPLLLCDEPTGNLDPETSIGIMQLIYRINRTGHDRRRGHPRQGDGRQDAPARDRAARGPRHPRPALGPLPPGRVDLRVRGAPARRARHRRRGPPELGRIAMRLGFFFKEALRALSRSAAPSLAALLTILLTALVLGVFIPVVQATTGTANEVRSRVVVDVFLKNGATKQQIEDTRAALLTAPERREGRVHLQGPGAGQGAQAQQGGLRAAGPEPACRTRSA